MQENLDSKMRRLVSDANLLTHSNDIEFKYHYHLLGYLKLIAGGTAIPKSIDILDKESHLVIKTIDDKKLLDELADD